MFSCSHFSDLLSNDQVGKQSAMSKRGQEATSNEGSPMAKPRPAIPAKARPINLVMRSPRSEKDSSQSLEYLVNPANADERKEVEIAPGNSWREEQLQTCAGCVKTRVSENGIHKPSIDDKDLSLPAQEVGNYSRLLDFLNGSIQKQMC